MCFSMMRIIKSWCLRQEIRLLTLVSMTNGADSFKNVTYRYARLCCFAKVVWVSLCDVGKHSTLNRHCLSRRSRGAFVALASPSRLPQVGAASTTTFWMAIFEPTPCVIGLARQSGFGSDFANETPHQKKTFEPAAAVQACLLHSDALSVVETHLRDVDGC